MKRQRLYVLAGLALVAVMLVGAATQVTREEFDALREQVEALENKVSEVEQRARQNSGNIVLLKGTVERVEKGMRGDGEQAGKGDNENLKPDQPRVEEQHTFELSALVHFNQNTPALVTGHRIFGTLRIVGVAPSPDDAEAVRIRTRDVQAEGGPVFCTFDLPSRQGMRMEPGEWYRVRGEIQAARIVSERKPSAVIHGKPTRFQTVVSLELQLKNVEATYRRKERSSTSGTFGGRL